MTTCSKCRIFSFLFAAFVLVEILMIGLIDKPLSIWLRGMESAYPSFIDIFRFYTVLGKGPLYIWPLGIGTGLSLLLLYARRDWPKKTRELLQISSLYFGYFFICTGGTRLILNVIKYLAGRARPEILESEGFYGFRPFNDAHAFNSFPSGHSATAFSLAFALIAIFPRARPWALGAAVLIALSRIMINAHYLSDVVAGAFLAWIAVALVTKQFYRSGLLPHSPAFPLISR